MNVNRLTTNLATKNGLNPQEMIIIDQKIEEFLSSSQIWVYDNGKVVNGSPFNNIKTVISALGFKKG